jgi:RHS repeat-associated protein
MATESIHSNAQNFPGFANGGVDARTGLYTFTLSLPALSSSDLLAPEFTLALTFSPIGGDDWGLGAGWSTNLSHLHLQRRLLKLSTGEQFRIDGSGQEPAIKERKLPSFRYVQSSETTAHIIHRTGAVEHLSRPGAGEYLMPHLLQGPTGHGLHLTYALEEGRPRLAEISDDDGQALLTLRRVGANLVINTATGDFLLTFANGRLERLDLPEAVGGAWTFQYTGTNEPYINITRVVQPLGAIETLHYDSKHQVPGNGMPGLPRVQRHEISPGTGLAEVVSEYTYGADNHNFLGFGGVSDWQGDDSDNLYRASPGYTYETTQHQINGDDRRTTRRLYNSFHLCTLETTQQGACVTERQTRFHLVPGDTFEAQPPQFQLPHRVTLQWRMEGQPVARSETTTTEFDIEGNLVRHVEPTGQETLYTYYPAEGETDSDGVACPADPWSFKRHYRTITQLPARAAGDPWFDDRTVATYRHVTVGCVEVAGDKPQPVGSAVQVAAIHTSSTRGGVTCCHQQELEYYHTPQGTTRHQHGRVKRRTEQVGSATAWATNTPSVEDHTYERILPTHTRALGSRLRTCVRSTAQDGTTSSAVREQDITTGLSLLSEDGEGTRMTYTYDALQRLLLAQVDNAQAPAARTFAYHTPSSGDTWPEALQTSATGVTNRQVFDRLGREIARHKTEGWQPEAAGQADSGRYWTGQYDGFGRLVTETHYDDCGPDARIQALTQTYGYDEWGHQARMLQADGTCQVTQTSPFGHAGNITTQWLESAPDAGGKPACQARTRTEMNAFGKPLVVELLNGEGSLEHSTRYRYDGWGQCLEQAEQFRQGTHMGPVLRTRMSYDPWGRLLRTELPNNDVFTQTFDTASREARVTALGYQAYDSGALEPVMLATREFDGLGRVTASSQGGRTSRYAYQGQKSGPVQVHNPDGTVIEYTYQPSLTASPLTAKSGEQQFRYAYDPTTAQLLAADSPSAQGMAATSGSQPIATAYRYSRTGQLQRETRHDQGQGFTTDYTSSFAGRLITRTDGGVGTARYGYDAAGRLISQQALGDGEAVVEQATLTYTAFGQVHTRTCGELVTQSTYDNMGRETERQILRQGAPLRGYKHAYDGNGNLVERTTLDENSQQVLREAFGYDLRNRLIEQHNEGGANALPKDRFGKPITQQVFIFDALDNVTSAITLYADTSLCMSTATFGDQDACQLASLTHTLMSSGRQLEEVKTETFTYDSNGRLISRDQGWQLTYDTFGQLTGLQGPDGLEQHYRYDPHGSLCAVEEAGGEQQRFYDGLSIDHVRQGQRVQRYLRSAGTPLALLEGDQATPLLTDYAGSVTGEWRENRLHTAIYDAYGNSQGGEPLACALGFNGELREHSGSDLYLLGRGYRLYDAALMRFLAPDDASPFGEGGLNPYAYCRGNPIMLYDPTGHMPQWTAANLPYYVAPPEEEQQGGGGFLGGLFKMVGWAFIGWEAFTLLKLGALALTAATGGLMAAGAAAAGVAAAALGVGVASMLDEDNEGLMYAAIAVGVFSGSVTGAARKAIKAGGVGARVATPRGSVASLVPSNGDPLADDDLLRRFDALRNDASPSPNLSRSLSRSLSDNQLMPSVAPEPPPLPSLKKQGPPVPPKPRPKTTVGRSANNTQTAENLSRQAAQRAQGSKLPGWMINPHGKSFHSTPQGEEILITSADTSIIRDAISN